MGFLLPSASRLTTRRQARACVMGAMYLRPFCMAISRTRAALHPPTDGTAIIVQTQPHQSSVQAWHRRRPHVYMPLSSRPSLALSLWLSCET